jgi:lactate dehydrogenase-like 2-hydroxyacid dehydrogenase
MKKLLISRSLPQAVVDAARQHFQVSARTSSDPMSLEEAVSALQSHDAVIPTLGDAFTAQAFAQAGTIRCQLLANFGVGYNHIDVAAAREAGVMVTNTPGAVTDATADIGVMLILMAARRASAGEAMVRADKWDGWTPTQLLGLHVSGKVLGVIGMGRIGRAIARRCHHGFGMDVVFHNRSRLDDAGVPARQLDDALPVARAADVVVVALPGGSATHHLIGAELFAAMQSHAIFVNIARGEIVDETALIAALQSGQIAGAGLDVYEHEPQVPAALRDMANVTLLPHLGTAALEVRVAMGMMAVDNLCAWDRGARPANLV